MFPNDDICNVKSAKSAAKRIFQRYSLPTSGLGQDKISQLIKNAYSAINIQYNPSNQDVLSFMSVFGAGNNQNIELNQLENLAVKYLCGEEALNLQNSILKKTQINDIYTHNQNGQRIYKKNEVAYKFIPETRIVEKNNQSTINSFSNLIQKSNISYSKSSGNLFYDKKTNIQTTLELDPLLTQSLSIFNQYKNKSLNGITFNEASNILKESYGLIGQKNYTPSEEDIKIWMKLCDNNQNGIISQESYQKFIKKMIERKQKNGNNQ